MQRGCRGGGYCRPHREDNIPKGANCGVSSVPSNPARPIEVRGFRDTSDFVQVHVGGPGPFQTDSDRISVRNRPVSTYTCKEHTICGDRLFVILIIFPKSRQVGTLKNRFGPKYGFLNVWAHSERCASNSY